jgi:hypothetical protein
MFGLYGKNRDRATKIFGVILSVIVILSMVFASFAYLF